MDQKKDIAEKIYWILIEEGPNYLASISIPLGQRMFFTAEDVKKDAEGLQTMRNLARNMTFLMKAIADGREKYGLPEVEHGSFTSFPDGK